MEIVKVKTVTVGPEYPAELSELVTEEKKPKKLKAKEMAEKVKATAVVSIINEPTIQQQIPQPQSSQNKKKDISNKKNKKLIRTAGGHTWEDTTLGEWEEGR